MLGKREKGKEERDKESKIVFDSKKVSKKENKYSVLVYFYDYVNLHLHELSVKHPRLNLPKYQMGMF